MRTTPIVAALTEVAAPVAAAAALITGTTSVISNGVNNLASSNNPSVGDFFTNADNAIIGGSATGWGLGMIADSGMAAWKILGGSFLAGSALDFAQSGFTNGEVTGADGVHAILNGAAAVGAVATGNYLLNGMDPLTMEQLVYGTFFGAVTTGSTDAIRNGMSGSEEQKKQRINYDVYQYYK
jgi:hypothetical protein